MNRTRTLKKIKDSVCFLLKTTKTSRRFFCTAEKSFVFFLYLTGYPLCPNKPLTLSQKLPSSSSSLLEDVLLSFF